MLAVQDGMSSAYDARDMAKAFHDVDRAPETTISRAAITHGDPAFGRLLDDLVRKGLIMARKGEAGEFYRARDAMIVSALMRLHALGVSPRRAEAMLRAQLKANAPTCFSEMVGDLLAEHLYELLDRLAETESQRQLTLETVRALERQAGDPQ